MTTKDFKLAEKHTEFHSNGPRRWCKFCSGTPLPNKAEMPETRFEWVSVKEEIVEGRPHMPQKVLDSTVRTLYDPSEHTDFKLMIRTGAGPQGELISNYKLYQISKFDMAGFRLKAMATIELPIWRRYEEEWFRAFLGAPLQINDPGLSGAISSGPHHQDSGEAKIRESTAGVSRKPSSDGKARGCSSKQLSGLTAWNT